MSEIVNASHISNLKASMEEAIGQGVLQQADFPLRHFFAKGLYCREISIPADGTAISAVHKVEHITLAIKGHVVVVDEVGNRQEVIAPAIFVTKPGTQRAVYAITDAIWATVHATDETDIEAVEKTLVCDTMSQYNQLLEAPL